MTNAMPTMLVSLTKEINKNSFVREHQYGGYDVKCKHSIEEIGRVKMSVINWITLVVSKWTGI